MTVDTANNDGVDGGVDWLYAATTLGASWIKSKNDVKTAAMVANAAISVGDAERRSRDDLVKFGIGLVLLTLVGTIVYRKFAR